MKRFHAALFLVLALCAAPHLTVQAFPQASAADTGFAAGRIAKLPGTAWDYSHFTGMAGTATSYATLRANDAERRHPAE